MIRHFASAITMVVVAACAVAPAHATDFLQAIEDVPLATGLTEKPEAVIFESEQGRVVRTSAEGLVRPFDIEAFYIASLPALGWARVDNDAALTFRRESETLRITMRTSGANGPVQVEFELIVKLASSRLPE